jgi:hypothetical protein
MLKVRRIPEGFAVACRVIRWGTGNVGVKPLRLLSTLDLPLIAGRGAMRV